MKTNTTIRNTIFGLFLAATAIPTSSILSPSESVATAQSSSARISNVRVTIRTGGDDLRSGSVAYGVVELRNGRKIKKNLNNGAGWGNNSTRTVSIPLPRRTRISDIVAFTVEHDGAPRRWPDSYDNWNMDSIRVTTPKVCSGGVQLANPSGRPLVRFTGGRKRRLIRLNLPSSVRNQRPSSLKVMIRTGGDDLRGGAVAYGTINLRNGRTLPKKNLNNGNGWRNNSTKTVYLPLRGTRLGDLASLTLEHDGAPRNIGEGYDNWNVDRVRVVTPQTCSTKTLLRKTGRPRRPLVRFTGGNTFKRFSI